MTPSRSRPRRPKGRRHESIDDLVERALSEDRWTEDRTTFRVLPDPIPSEATVLAQAPGILSGMSAARAIARRAHLRIIGAAKDGEKIRAGRAVLTLRGDARRILSVERTLLNFLMHASGVATETRRALRAARGRSCRPGLEIWATRKTLPGLRELEKAAVVHGGGRPHRRDLSEAILLKNNHLALVPLSEAIHRARRGAAPGEEIQVEVRTLPEALEAQQAGARSFLIDNARPAEVARIVRALRSRPPRVWIEISGGITPATVGRYRRCGADAASLGSLTHSARALPFHLRLRPLDRKARAPE
jgi:nicotinate-nucleotide pyrophosphorylase (carboxylating)